VTANPLPTHSPILHFRNIRSRYLEVPMRFPLGTSAAKVTSAPLLLVDVDMQEGVTGRSYLFCYRKSGAKAIAAVLDEAMELIRGRTASPVDIAAYLARRYALLGVTGAVRMALAALDIATWDALASAAGLPLATYLGGDTFWSKWTNLWTAEEDRHGAILHDYARDSLILDNPVLERMQFEYLKAGFEPSWDKDPYRVFVYTTLQERATQVSHANTGKLASEYEPTIGIVLQNVAKEEARHYTFYRQIFKEVLVRDPNRALASAAEIMPSIDMPGVNMPHFREMADVIRRAGIYGPRDYLRIVEEQIRFWAIETLDGLDEMGKKAQEKILGIPSRLARIADAMETRSRAKSFSFAVAFGREFSMQ